jgi:hypothetical protein
MEIFVKDMALGHFLRKFPELSETLGSMRARLPEGYRAYLVDYVVMDCVPGTGTCRDTRWHVDGDPRRDNLYVLRVEGPNRTEFLLDPVELPELPEGREEQNRLLEDLLKDRLPLRIPEGEERVYDSRTPHRGVLCDEPGRRTFLRLMATNYIKPKNIVRRGGNVPFRPAT